MPPAEFLLRNARRRAAADAEPLQVNGLQGLHGRRAQHAAAVGQPWAGAVAVVYYNNMAYVFRARPG